MKEQFATPQQKRKGLNTSHRAAPIFCQLSCLQGCAVNLLNEIIQVRNSSLERRWRGEVQNIRSFICFHSMDARNQWRSQLEFFSPLLCCIVKKSSATTLKWFERETLAGTQFLLENNKKLVDARLSSCVIGYWIQLKSCKRNQSSFLNEIYENKESQCLNNLSRLYQCCLSNYSVCSLVWEVTWQKSMYEAD